MDITNMKVDDILMLNGLVGVAKEAKEAADIISKAYSKGFGIKEDKIEVWRDRDSNNFEYLTHDGIWQARYLHQSYDVDCTADGIFDYLKAEYLIKNGYTAGQRGCYLTAEGEKAMVVAYFRTFVHRTKELIGSDTNEDLNEEFLGESIF